jgi:hypothetical protein
VVATTALEARTGLRVGGRGDSGGCGRRAAGWVGGEGKKPDPKGERRGVHGAEEGPTSMVPPTEPP